MRVFSRTLNVGKASLHYSKEDVRFASTISNELTEPDKQLIYKPRIEDELIFACFVGTRGLHLFSSSPVVAMAANRVAGNVGIYF